MNQHKRVNYLKELKIKNIDVEFDFTTDTPGYWDGFWTDSLGKSNVDPDAMSKTLQEYHRLLWSKPLPNGEYMQLTSGIGSNYLTWRNFRFGSDSIIASFRYERNRQFLKQVEMVVPAYRDFVESFLRKSYTIGGCIIFPKRRGGINQSRGCHAQIRDRWDLTLECIRRYYLREESPLSEVLNADKEFFDLFIDFRGYVDFFHLQDCVNAEYDCVKFWMGDGAFDANPLPQTVSDYLKWIEAELDFVEKRNARIAAFCDACVK